jgi:hypothetical protein
MTLYHYCITMKTKVDKSESEWIHARVPAEMQGAVGQLLERGYSKTEIAMRGIKSACKAEGIKARA